MFQNFATLDLLSQAELKPRAKLLRAFETLGTQVAPLVRAEMALSRLLGLKSGGRYAQTSDQQQLVLTITPVESGQR